MQHYEYKVVPAPTRGEKAKGYRTGAERFAHGLEVLMNRLGSEGWEYVRADTLPAEERTGFTGRTTVYQHLLVFRRPKAESGETGSAEAEIEKRFAFPRLRFGADRGAQMPRLELTKAEGKAPPLGPATQALPDSPAGPSEKT
ncbi:MAG: hypothetical protein RLZZ528_2185 [Pseudomonadota bacterium]|jgi:Domain of unknown function (DUF4177)